MEEGGRVGIRAAFFPDATSWGWAIQVHRRVRSTSGFLSEVHKEGLFGSGMHGARWVLKVSPTLVWSAACILPYH